MRLSSQTPLRVAFICVVRVRSYTVSPHCVSVSASASASVSASVSVSASASISVSVSHNVRLTCADIQKPCDTACYVCLQHMQKKMGPWSSANVMSLLHAVFYIYSEQGRQHMMPSALLPYTQLSRDAFAASLGCQGPCDQPCSCIMQLNSTTNRQKTGFGQTDFVLGNQCPSGSTHLRSPSSNGPSFLS